MKLSYLLPEGSYRSRFHADQIEVANVCEHTAQMQAGDLFIAVSGERFDPLLLLSEMERVGVGAILLEEGVRLPHPPKVPCFYVPDILSARSAVWNKFYGSPSEELTLIGITGTNGKTTTAHILTHILNHSGKKAGYIGTLGAFDSDGALAELTEGNMTTPSPQALFRTLRVLLNRGITHVVLEVSSHALSQKRTLPISFEVSVFTNLTEDHLDYHESMEEYYSAKKLLFAQSKHALINIDDAYGDRLYHDLTGKKSALGIIQSAPFTITDLHEKEEGGTQYTCVTPYNSFTLSYPLFGAFNIYNSLSAVCAALLLDVCPHEIASALSVLPPIPGRLERLDLSAFDAPFSVIIDYAHTPDAMEQCIKCAKRITRGKLYVLFGAGGDREREKRAQMGAIAEKYADFVFVTADNSRSESLMDIIHDIVSGMTDKAKRRVISNRKEAIEAVLKEAKENDTVLLLGKGHENYIIGKNGKEHFSEKEIVTAFFEQRQKVL